MIRLPETTRAMFDLGVDFDHRPGMHLVEESRIGSGLVIANTAFEATRDDVSQIDPVSLWDDWPKVAISLPYNQLGVNVLVDHYSAAWLPPELKKAQTDKQKLMLGLGVSIVGAVIAGDSSNLYVFRDPQDKADLPLGGRPVKVQSLEDFTNKIKQFARFAGLSFLISDFEQLPIDQLPGGLIALKTNHLLELRLPKARGYLSLGQNKEVNLANNKELEAANKELTDRHRSIGMRLAARHCLMAQAIYNPELEEGYDSRSIDFSIAQAIRQRQRTEAV